MASHRAKRGPKPLRRRVETRTPRKTILVFCEGKRTEPEYLAALRREPTIREVAAVDIQIEMSTVGSAPVTLVEAAVAARRKALKEEAEIDQFWCIFDVEWPKNHPNLKKALQLATANGIRLAISNPCFELWLALHRTHHTQWLDNDGARRLRRNFDGKLDKGLDPSIYIPFRRQAAGRAAKLDERHLKDGTQFPHNNPSSGMHHFIAEVDPGQGDALG